MPDDVSLQILHAIRTYLARQFPGAHIEEDREPSTRSIFFHIKDANTHRRLEVTEAYLDGDGGADLPIAQLTNWDLAATLREAKDCLVRLMTTGVHIEPSTMP